MGHQPREGPEPVVPVMSRMNHRKLSYCWTPGHLSTMELICHGVRSCPSLMFVKWDIKTYLCYAVSGLNWVSLCSQGPTGCWGVSVLPQIKDKPFLVICTVAKKVMGLFTEKPTPFQHCLYQPFQPSSHGKQSSRKVEAEWAKNHSLSCPGGPQLPHQGSTDLKCPYHVS
jgi:hypothetical protein